MPESSGHILIGAAKMCQFSAPLGGKWAKVGAMEPKNFTEFWPFYVREHRSALNRRLHFVGTSCGLILVVVALLTDQFWWIALAPICGYGFAWFGHFRVEKNRPATLRFPFYSFVGDQKMFVLMLFGCMDAEIQKIKANAELGPKSR